MPVSTPLPPPALSPHSARAALAFLRDSGVDGFVGDSPRNWLSSPPQPLQEARSPQARPSPSQAAVGDTPPGAPRQAVQPIRATSLAALEAEVSAYPHPLNPGGGVRPLLLQGPEAASLLLFVETLPAADSDAARLVAAMMAAIGLSMTQVALVPLLPWPTSGGRPARPEELAAFAPVSRAAALLARPRLALALGPHLAAPLLASQPRPGDWQRLDDIALLTTLSPALLLRSPALKLEVWTHLQSVQARLA